MKISHQTLGYAWLMVLMIALVFGKTLQQDWGTAGTQMVYSLILFVLVFLAQHDGFGISNRRENN